MVTDSVSEERSAEPEPVIGMVCPPDENEPLIVILTVFLSSVVRAPSITCAAASRDPGPLPPITTKETTTIIASAAAIIDHRFNDPLFGSSSTLAGLSAPVKSP